MTEANVAIWRFAGHVLCSLRVRELGAQAITIPATALGQPDKYI
jgi:hypothetical protein